MKKIIIIVATLIILIGFSLYIFRDKGISSVNKYKTDLLAEAKIDNILEHLDVKEYMDSFEKEQTSITVKLNSELEMDYKVMEKDAAVLMHLIGNLEKVTYEYMGDNYDISKEYINNIFENIKTTKPDVIYDRYTKQYFNNDSITYHGNINGVYNLFDESIFCSSETTLVKEENGINYYISCTQLPYLYLIDNNLKKIILIDAIENNVITISDLKQTNLKIIAEPVETNDENSN